jgi:hypothetical protein
MPQWASRGGIFDRHQLVSIEMEDHQWLIPYTRARRPARGFIRYTLTEPGPELGSADVVGTEETDMSKRLRAEMAESVQVDAPIYYLTE